VATLFLFIVFASVDYFLVLMRYQLAQHINSYYLERIRVCGMLTEEDKNDMVEKYGNIGLVLDLDNMDSLVVNGVNGSVVEGGASGQSIEPVRRNIEDPDESKIEVKITLKQNKGTFMTGKMIGSGKGNDMQFVLGGTVLSEKV
jgi:hypothetical protein